MSARINPSGLVVAGIGFFLTRFTVTLAIYEEPVRFYVGGVIPLILGLSLAAFGVALAVADVDRRLVRTTAVWCTVGLVTMSVLVVLTLVGSTADGGLPDLATVRSQAYLSNFLIGGSIGGTLTGLYAAKNHQQRRHLRQQTSRLTLLNQLLRHKVLNAVTVIQGYAALPDRDDDVRQVIDDHSRTIVETIEDLKYLTRYVGDNTTVGRPVELQGLLEASVERVRVRHPAASVSITPMAEDVRVRASERLEQVISYLLENAIIHSGDTSPVIDVTTTGATVRISVIDEGPGFSETQQALLETGEVEHFDDPETGFGLSFAHLFVEEIGGEIETEVSETGSTVTVVLPSADPDADPNSRALTPHRSALRGVRPALPHLVVAFVAAVIAGVVYGITSEALGGSIAGIGVFYGTPDPVIGWLTHEFHSIVFGFVFVGLVSLLPVQYRDSVMAYLLVGIAWALVLWVGAAGVIAPIWLRLLGFPASLPSLSARLLVNHLVWGLSLSLLTAGGYRYALPWLGRVGDRLQERLQTHRSEPANP